MHQPNAQDATLALPVSQELVNRYSQDIAELRRYTLVWKNNFKTCENVMNEYGCVCKKCEFVKPLRTHHCSVCKKCVLLMDHHCMWTNNCIGLHNYKQFLQLNLYGQLACWYTVLTISLAKSEDTPFFYFAKCWDMLIAKFMLALTGFNFYVMSTGLTYLEFKSMLENRARDLNQKFYGKIEPTGNPG